MITLPPPPKRRRNLETDTITRPAIEAINALPGCWAARNDAKFRQVGGRFVAHNPLGEGSGDILFSTSYLYVNLEGEKRLARIGWIETKTRARRNRKDDAHQESWASAMRRKGHFVAKCTSVEECLAAVERCRMGEFK